MGSKTKRKSAKKTRAARTGKPKRPSTKGARAMKSKRTARAAKQNEPTSLEPPVLPTPIATFTF